MFIKYIVFQFRLIALESYYELFKLSYPVFGGLQIILSWILFGVDSKSKLSCKDK